MQKSNPKKQVFKKQTQKRPGIEQKMVPNPVFIDSFQGSNKLLDKKCIVTGGDSGIGRAVALAFAREGADVALIYLKAEQEDALHTAAFIRKTYGRECLLVATNIARENNCIKAVEKITKKFSRIDVLVNNAGIHYPAESLLDITTENLQETFAVNVFAMFWLTKAALPFMEKGASIINTSSVTAYRGSGGLIDYSATKGAIVSFTRSLSANLVDQGIRVNGVAPGPIWTPLIPASFPADQVAKHGTDSPKKRPGQPVEVAPAYVFLASNDASYMTGQILHVNGGEIVNG